MKFAQLRIFIMNIIQVDIHGRVTTESCNQGTQLLRVPAIVVSLSLHARFESFRCQILEPIFIPKIKWSVIYVPIVHCSIVRKRMQYSVRRVRFMIL
jgi:hypothetical protein